MTAKELRKRIKNKEKIDYIELDRLINSASEKVGFFERFGDKGATRRLLIDKFDDIVSLITPEGRRMIISKSDVNNNEIYSKILDIAVDFLKTDLDVNNKKAIDKDFLGNVFNVAYKDERTEQSNNNKLKEYLENNFHLLIQKEGLNILTYIDVMRNNERLDQFINMLKRNYNAFLDVLSKNREEVICDTILKNPEYYYNLFSGKFNAFYERMKDEKSLIELFYDKHEKNGFKNLRQVFENHPDFKEEVIDTIRDISEKNGLRDEKNFVWMCKLLDQCDSIDAIGNKMQNFFDSKEKRVIDGHYAKDYIDIIGKLSDPKLSMQLLKMNSKQLLEITTTPIATLSKIKEINEKLIEKCDGFSEEKMVNIEELNKIVDGKTLEIAWEIGFNTASVSLDETIEESSRLKDSLKKKFPDITVSEMIDREKLRSITRGDMVEEARTAIKNDTEVTVLQKIIQELIENEGVRPSQIELIGSGGYSTVYGIGDKVLKIGNVSQQYAIKKNHPRLLQPLIRRTDIIENKYVEVSEKCDMSQEIEYEELYKIYEELRDVGLIWTDAKTSNVGILKKPNKAYFKRIGTTKEDGNIEWGSAELTGIAQGIGNENDEMIKANPYVENYYVIVDSDYIYAEDDKRINWPKGGTYSRTFEERYQKEHAKSKNYEKENDSI